MIALALVLVLSQAPGGNPGSSPPAATEEQKCQMDCGLKIAECQQPCAPKNAAEADNPELRKKFIACTKECAKKNQPCLDACQSKSEKGKKK